MVRSHLLCVSFDQCSSCNDGAVILERAPCSWDDVLKAGSVKGVCHADGCPATAATGGVVDVVFYFKCAAVWHKQVP